MLLRYRWIVFFIVAILILIGLVFSVRFVFGGDEDFWACVDGEWVAHGNPRSERPDEECKQIQLLSVSYVDSIGEKCDTAASISVIDRDEVNTDLSAERLVRQWLNFYLDPKTCLTHRLAAYSIDNLDVRTVRSQYMTVDVEISLRPYIEPNKLWIGTLDSSGWIKTKVTLDIGRAGGKYLLKNIFWHNLLQPIQGSENVDLSSSTTLI